jgi:hypothetical protein
MSPPLSLLFLRITDGDPSFSKSDDLWSEVILSYIALRFVFSVSLCDREEELESLCLREEELESLCLREEELESLCLREEELESLCLREEEL